MMEEDSFLIWVLILGLLTILLTSICHRGNFYFQLFLLILIFVILIIFRGRFNMFNMFKVNKLSKKANAFFGEEKYEDALLIYDEILDLDKNNINALYYKSLISFNKKEYLKSLDLLNYLLSFEDVFEAVLLKGRVLIVLGNVEEGLRYYKKSFHMDKFDLFVYLDEITYFGDPILFKNNKKMFEISLRLCNFYLNKQDDVYVIYYKGQALSNLGRCEESLDVFSYLSNLYPEFSYGYSTKSEILFKMGRYGEALELLDKGLEITSDERLNYNISFILYRVDKFEEALQYINKFLNSKPYDERGLELKRDIEDKLSL